MELFSEIYSCYYQVVDSILKKAEEHPVTRNEMEHICAELGFAESGFYILPKLISGEWQLLTSDDQLHYRARTKEHSTLPLTALQRSWLRTLLQDDRFRLFFTEEELSVLSAYVANASLLWDLKDFHYYDRFKDGDNYADPDYRSHFQTLLSAISKRQYVTITYQSQKGQRITHHYLPLKLEYSSKNDQFRLLAMPERMPYRVKERRSIYMRVINLCGIRSIQLLDRFAEEALDFTALVRKSYYKEPVRLLISNGRNALERAMLHFSNYEKKTKKIDENTWECLIYYNNSMETELLIEILSFGPAVRILGPDSFLKQAKDRLRSQAELLARTEPFSRPETITRADTV